MKPKDLLDSATAGCKLMLLMVALAPFYNSCDGQNYRDVDYYSSVFEAERSYRIYLPDNYTQSSKRYPVIYYFHGFGGRYKWDSYALEDDASFPENGRKTPPFVMEWSDYTRNHDVIIVSWDGYEPNAHPGRKTREGLVYGTSRPYDYDVAHEQQTNNHWGWDFRPYFRELVEVIDRNYRTLSDRNHRAITGFSMGGQTAYYIAGQCKDLVSGVSAFDPADNIAMYGPKGNQVALPVLELYRGLSGLKTRLQMTDGDWLKYNDKKLKHIFGTAYPEDFSFHLADYPNHWAADIPVQLDFHMNHFGDNSRLQHTWNHISPFPSFEVLGYSVNTESTHSPIVLLEKKSFDILKVKCQEYIPDGPMSKDAMIRISTPKNYEPRDTFEMIAYNIQSNTINRDVLVSSDQGQLEYNLEGGGHILGINQNSIEKTSLLQWVARRDQTYHFFEEGIEKSLDLKLINLGLENAKYVTLTISSPNDRIEFTEDKVSIDEIGSGEVIDLQKSFAFTLRHYSDSMYMSGLDIVTSVKGVPADTQKVLYYPIPYSPAVPESDILILDGRMVENVPVFRQGPNEVEKVKISGGKGNGNGRIESGETVLVYIKLDKGLGPKDINTYHRSFLLNSLTSDFIEVKSLDYQEKLNQAGATSVASLIYVSDKCPDNQELDLWFKVESLYNDPDDPTSNATVYAQKDYFRKLKLKVNVR